MSQPQKRNKGSSITRVLEILEAIASAQQPPSVLDLSVGLDIPKPSLHRLLQMMQKEAYIGVDMHGGLVVGSRTNRLVLNVLKNEKAKIERTFILENLSNKIGETCGIAVLQQNHMLYLDRVQTNWPLQINLPIGAEVPLWCTSSGKLFLACLSMEKRRNVLAQLPLTAMTKNTITDPKQLEESLQRIQEEKFGTDDEEFIAGMVACAVPILDKTGEIYACLYTHAPTIRKSINDLRAYEQELRLAADQLNTCILL